MRRIAPINIYFMRYRYEAKPSRFVRKVCVKHFFR